MIDNKTVFTDLTVYPDNQAEAGFTLNELLYYLQYFVPLKDKVCPIVSSDSRYGKWEPYLCNQKMAISRSGEYITNPIRINLLEGEYNVNTYVRVNTASDFTIEGKGADTEIKVGFNINEIADAPHWNNSHKIGLGGIVAFLSPWEKEIPAGLSRDNCLTIKNLSLRFSDGIRFPYYKKDENGNDEEQVLGVLVSYASFHKVIISGLDMEAKHNGEVTLINGDECDHLEITGCRLYLDNWHDRVVGEWEKRREQGTNLNVRGNNKSAFIEGNTFIKHGNDEALSFFATLPDNSTMVTHENVRVVRNTFTYLDADPVSGPVGGGTEARLIRPMHINGVLITFNPGNDVANRDIKTVWKDFVFAENTLNLEGPVCSAVGMNVLPGDVCHNVSFERNRIFHKYIDTHQLPGNGILDGIGTNGALPYVYSNTFVFETKKDRTDLAPGTKGAASGAETEIKPTPVVYRGNYIRYTQKTYDQPEISDPEFYWSYEHSCFALHGGDIEILDNYIDSTGAVVVRHDPSDGIYGNPGNPVTLFHCLPCQVPGRYSVRISGNEAVKYGVTLSCRPQYTAAQIIDDYTVRMENNTFSDGAAMVLYNTKNSDIAVVRNSFTGCSKETFIQAKYGVKLLSDPSVKLSLFQNKIAPGFGLGSYCNVIAADVPKDSPVLTPISEFCFMLNYLPGYAGMSMPEKNTAAQSHISDNLFESRPSNVCGS